LNTAIIGLGTANPPRYVTGREAYDFFTSHFKMEKSEKELYRRILLEGPIRGRYVGIDYDEQACQQNPDELNARFLKFARPTAAQAARKAMAQAGISADQVAGLVVNTCTGYLCPGLTSYLAEDLELSETLHCFDVMGMGCGAAIPNLELSTRLADGREQGMVLSIAVEITSATIYTGSDPELVVSNSIFGDGASAVVLGNHNAFEGVKPMVQLLDFASAMQPRYRSSLGYKTIGGRLRNVLSPRVPAIGAKISRKVVSRLLERYGLAMTDIRWWAVHPGGTRVLEKVEHMFGLGDGQLRFSYEVLAEYGNMSSPSVMFVLERMLASGGPRPGEKGILLSFGAGFSAFAALFEVV
jgi:predicted naringenin-chalcone synthase